MSNELTTSKYSTITFLPINPYAQFKRVANLYFLLLIGLQVSGNVFKTFIDTGLA